MCMVVVRGCGACLQCSQQCVVVAPWGGACLQDDDSTASWRSQDVVSGRVSMLSETEELYNQLITQSVAENDIDKALRLVEEAERAGSRSARNTFIERVKELK